MNAQTLIYPENFESKIGFSTIRDLLVRYCLSSLGRERAEQMSFSNDLQEIDFRLNKALEFKQIYQTEDNFPQNNYVNLLPCLSRLAFDGTVITLDELIDLRKSLAVIYSIVSFFGNDTDEKYPNLKAMAGEVSVHRQVLARIGNILDANNLVRDTASSELLQIRRQILQKRSDVNRVMQRLMKTARTEGWADKDSELSLRDGRLVIPMNSYYKRRLQGFVHDESATGKTSFVEPVEAFELNNEVQKLEFDEQREIHRILSVFSDFVREFVPDMIKAYHFLAEIDFLRANAKLAVDLDAVKPNLNESPIVQIFNGRHPLLVLTFASEHKEVVPLKITLDEDNRILLISGPNAGGKSVCLKSVGLLQYMLQCGLLVPVSEYSKMGIFDRLFIDIGDEQSLENDLSTYSSHLYNMKFFVEYANKRTLFLIDEFGAGTEPLLGGAIAESVLEELNKQHAWGVINTHYTNLKHFAGATKGICNGAMLFDSQNMRPLYELSIGSPGSSFAFEIARTIGLPPHIIELAKQKVGKEHVDFDKNLQDVEHEKRFLEQKRKEIQQKELRLQENLLKYNAKLEKINELKKEIIGDATRQAKELLAETNKRIENTIRTIKESQAEKERTQQARAEIESFKDEFDKAKLAEDERINRKIEKIKQKQQHIINKQQRTDPEKSIQKTQKIEEPQFADGEICIGDKVIIRGQNVPGEVVEISGKNSVVTFGNITTKVKIDKLQKITDAYFKKIERQVLPPKQKPIDLSQKRLTFKSQLDVRGMRGDEAMFEVRDFVEEGIVLGVKQLMILHGKGDGILRKIIREYLSSVDMVRSFSDAHIDMGGAGITIIELE